MYIPRMLVVAVVAQKGGVGKSMLARSLAVQGLIDGRKTALIDADPQGTVTAWGKRRRHDAPAIVALGRVRSHTYWLHCRIRGPAWW